MYPLGYAVVSWQEEAVASRKPSIEAFKWDAWQRIEILVLHTAARERNGRNVFAASGRPMNPSADITIVVLCEHLGEL
jgi:hypothetical protein